MSNGNATLDDTRHIAHWIEQEYQNRVGTRACLADLRRERDRVIEAFKKIQKDRKKVQKQKKDFESIKRNQQEHCEHLHNILDGKPSYLRIFLTLFEC